jgi:hypothetical protein
MESGESLPLPVVSSVKIDAPARPAMPGQSKKSERKIDGKARDEMRWDGMGEGRREKGEGRREKGGKRR